MLRIVIGAYTMLLAAMGKHARWEAMVEWAAKRYPDWASVRAAQAERYFDKGQGALGFGELRAARDVCKGRRRVYRQEDLCGHLAYYLQFDEAELELEVLRKLDPKAGERMAELYKDYRTETDDPARKLS